jgi:hypothetical protein
MLSTYANILLKALDYWKLRYSEKHKQWQLESESALGAFQARRYAGLGDCETFQSLPPFKCSTCDGLSERDFSDWGGLSEFDEGELPEFDDMAVVTPGGAGGRGRGGEPGRGRGRGWEGRRGMIPAPAGAPVTRRDKSIRGRSSVRGGRRGRRTFSSKTR